MGNITPYTQIEVDEYPEGDGIKALATAVLERWLFDAKSSHLWAVEEDTDDARPWLEVCGISPEAFKEMYDRAREEGRNKQDAGQTLSQWYVDAKKNGRRVSSGDYKKYCRDHHVKGVNDPHRIWELMHVSNTNGDGIFETRSMRLGSKAYDRAEHGGESEGI